ncbi:hypothetical protein [Absidia glauca]|uniref:Ndc10 domain-containing protein n=1 Tax=Absidia glauca TaxID=4829 RepID=A0A163KMY8_ABSGL|nr:hypothetical protein [Absidia glauca]
MKIKPPRQAQKWSYFSHRESIGKASSSLGIRSSKNTHINCGSSARMAAFQENWCDQWQHSRFFYLARAALNPLTSLCKKLFLAIGEWHDRLAAKELSPGNPIQPTVAENAFVQMIMMFRKTFIQDLVLMMELHPCYTIWQHSIFSDPAYLSFKRQVHIIA